MIIQSPYDYPYNSDKDRERFAIISNGLRFS